MKLQSGMKVITLKDQTCRYYNYPAGHNLHKAPAGSVGIIKTAYIPKVHPGPGSDYFAIIKIAGVEYSLLHSDIKQEKKK